MNDIVKEYMETGKDLNTICNDKIKTNNYQWFLIVVLFIVVFGGYSAMITKRNIELRNDLNYTKACMSEKDSIISFQYRHLETAVYFEDIK